MGLPLGLLHRPQGTTEALSENPQDIEGFSLMHFHPDMSEERRATLASLPSYGADVVLRETFREPETTSSGGRIHSELVHLVDSTGKRVIRELTIGEPNPKLGPENISPFAWVETDPWCTGPDGLNRKKIGAYIARGFPVFWLHHGDEHTGITLDKSVSRSAHQTHSTLDDLGLTATFDTQTVLMGGFSRGAITDEKAIVIADQYGRKVPFSDFDALVFARDMTRREKVLAAAEQIPKEMLGIVRLAHAVYRREGLDGLTELAKTPDFHPRNIAQEIIWAGALINSHVSRYIAHLPRDTSGIRVFYSGDVMSQQREYEKLYEEFPDIAVVTEAGPHVFGAHPEYLDKKYARLDRIMEYLRSHDMSLTGIRPDDVLPPTESLSLRRQRRSFWQTLGHKDRQVTA